MPPFGAPPAGGYHRPMPPDPDADILTALAAAPPRRGAPHLLDDPREIYAGIGTALRRLRELGDRMAGDFADGAGIRPADAAELATLADTLRTLARRIPR